jgi:short-subunit dehydrogenase
MNTKKLLEVAVVTGASKGICATIVRLMKRRNLIDLVEHFRTQHALQEERAMTNFHASTNGGAVGPNFIR